VSSAPGFKVFEVTCAFTFVAPDDLLTIPWMALSIDSMRFVSSAHAIQLQGSDFHPGESIPHWYISLFLNILLGSFLPSLWAIDKPSLLDSEEPALLCNHVGAQGSSQILLNEMKLPGSLRNVHLTRRGNAA
jgi:hypothetical protein